MADPPSLEEFLAQYGQAQQQGPAPLGGFVNPAAGRRPFQGGGTFGEPGSHSQRVSPGYAESDEWSRFVGLAPEAAGAWQRRMAAAGLLQGEFRYGRWDEPSAAAMAKAMALGNAWGTDFGTVLDELAMASQEDTGAAGQLPPRNQFLQPAYQAPTADMLAQEVKGFVRDRLGREPDDADIATLTDALARFHRRDYEAQVGVDRSEFGRSEDARMAEAEAALAGDAQAGGVGGPGEFDATGPDAVAARFAEYFEDEYAGELDRNTRVEQGGEGERGFMASVLSTDRAIGGI